MNTPTRYSVSTHELTDEAFAPFGDIIKPRRSGDQGDRAYAYRPGQEKNHVELVASNEPMIRIMHQFKRGLEFNIVARHLRVSQCLGSLQGKEWFIAVAKPDAAFEDGHPRLDRISAFRIPGDRLIKIHTGTWHAGPHFTHDECMFVSFENVDTNTRDFDVVKLPTACAISA
jgi:ureidoglycolate hydrolase